MSFESELRDALRRKEPPEDFVERVMSGVVTGDPARHAGRRRPSPHAARYVAAAMLVIITTISGWKYQKRREGERAKEQLMLALRITSQKLHATEQRLER